MDAYARVAGHLRQKRPQLMNAISRRTAQPQDIDRADGAADHDTDSLLVSKSSAQPIGVLGRPWESRSDALRRTSSGAPYCRAMLARIALSLAQASA